MAQPTRSRRTKRRTRWAIWVPESVLLRSKMIYASSKDAIQKLTGVSKNYKQAERRSRPTPLLSPWNASLCDQPPAPCLKHPLAQTCPPSGTCRLSSQTGEAWEDSSRKRAVPLSHLPEQSSPAPGLFASIIPDGSSLPQTTFDLLIPLGLKQNKFVSVTQWEEKLVFLLYMGEFGGQKRKVENVVIA